MLWRGCGLTEPNPAFPRSYGKISNWTSAPDFGALLIRPILAEQPLGPVRSSQCQPSTREFSLSRKRSARRQRVFFIEEKACQTPEAGAQRVLFIVEKKPYRDQSAGGARKRHVFCAVCPCRPAGPALGRFYYIFQAATAGSIIVKRRFSSSSSIIR